MSKQASLPEPLPALPARPGEPAYLRIKRCVVEHIGHGKLRHGDQVPSEADLVRIFRVSRMTAHRALRELTTEQVLRRVQGLGTFVAEPKVTSTVVAIRSIQHEIEARGHQYSSEVLKLEKVRLSGGDVPLALPEGTVLFHALVLHKENGIPLQLEDRYVNPQIAPDFLRQDFSAGPPGDYLVRVSPIWRAEHSIEALAPNRQVTRLLKLKSGEPCLVLNRHTWSGNLPATFARLYHPGSRYRYTAEIQTR